MKEPKSDIQEVLFIAINKGRVSLIDFPKLAGFRTRISELKLKFGVQFDVEKLKCKNRNGNTMILHEHRIIDIEKAKSVYNKITRL